MFVLGTAGHIDHGKSSLVQALTGTDPDRFAEEKVRGMTIDLGFAWLKLPDGREIGIVDVPGHERFVRNMLAGAGGIDIAMLVIAANEGIMPQTREHLAILNLLGISRGLVALTKKDLVDTEWLDLVKMEVEDLLNPTTLTGATVIPVSAVTREGIPELLSAIEQSIASTPPKQDKGRPRLPIDRVFSIAGAGTVVTGTLVDGWLSMGQEVELVPSGLKSRIRGLQSHKSAIETVGPGSRAAVNLINITTTEAQRGEILTTPGWLKPTSLMSAKLHIIPNARHALPHNAERSIYILAAEATVKIRLLDAEEIKPGDSGWVQLILDRPMAVIDGDHFIIRSTTETLGGGVIIDTHAHRMPRFKPAIIESFQIREKGSPEEWITGLLEAKKSLELVDIMKYIPLEQEIVRATIEELISRGLVIRVGQSNSGLLYASSAWQELISEARKSLSEFHKKYPLRAGMPKIELINRLRLGKFTSQILDKLLLEKVVMDDGLIVRLPDFKVYLNTAEQNAIEIFLKSLSSSPYSPPGDNIPKPDLLTLLVDRGQVIKLSDSVVVSKQAYNDMTGEVLTRLQRNGKITLAEVRDMFQTSRKYAQALLEYMDGQKITRRVGDERVKY